MTAIVDQDTCISCGLCTEMVPGVFQFNDAGKAEAVTQPDGENEGMVQEAIESCPVAAIHEGAE